MENIQVLNINDIIDKKVNEFDKEIIQKLIDFINENNKIKQKKLEEGEKKPEKFKNIIDKNSDKYKVVLDLVNKILINIGKKPIDDLTNFQKIDRLDIIKEINIKMLIDIEDNIFKYFDKKKCGYYRKTESIVLNLLRSLCKELGLKLTKKKGNKIVNNYIQTHYFYSIN